MAAAAAVVVVVVAVAVAAVVVVVVVVVVLALAHSRVQQFRACASRGISAHPQVILCDLLAPAGVLSHDSYDYVNFTKTTNTSNPLIFL